MLEDSTPHLHEHNLKNFKRKHGGAVMSDPESKEYKTVSKKRRLLETYHSGLYGYKHNAQQLVSVIPEHGVQATYKV
jgi:hypothetical protein